MSVKTKIFAYKNFVGAETDLNEGKFLNDPLAEGQLGCVVPLEECIITPLALELLKNATREGGSFASIMVMEGSIGLLGGWKHLFDSRDDLLSRDCKKDYLDKIAVEDFTVPQDFIDHIDQY